MATIKDVANLAGLSVATVSRAINGSGYVSKESQKKIDQAVEALDFTPNEVARSLFQKKSKFIGLLLPDITNPFFPLIAKGVEAYFSEKGYQVILGSIQENPEKTKHYLQAFEQNNIAGILSAVGNPTVQPMNSPMVLLDRVDKTAEYAVYSDDWQGGELAAKAILAGKPKNLVVIGVPDTILDRAKNRQLGAEAVLIKAEQAYQVIVSRSYLLEDARATAKALFETYPEVDSVIAASDVHAIAILQEAYQRGYQIPEDLQLIGYDDIPTSDLVVPRLSTIHQPAFQIGYQGAEMLHQLITNQKVQTKKMILPVHLVHRETLRKKEKQ
ncbi:LacI family DNA-binding transcriptional regulator [Enterococcus sp. LJL98]